MSIDSLVSLTLLAGLEINRLAPKYRFDVG